MGFLNFVQANARFLAVGALLTLSSSYGQTFFISIFAGEIQGTFGLSHGQWGTLYSASTALSALVMVWAGTLTDVFRVRTLAPVVLIGLALSCISMALTASTLMLALTIFALRLLGQGMSAHTATVAMARWFVANRGRALSVTGAGFSVGEACLPIVFVALLAVTDWRNLWVLAAILCLLAVVPITRFLRHERTPQSIAAEVDAAGMEGRHWTRTDALRHPLFWLTVPALLALPAFGTAFFFLQVHFAEIKGFSHAALVSLFPVYTLTAIGAMFVSGIAVDRFGTRGLIPFFLLPDVLGFLVLGQANGILMTAFGLFLLGLTSGCYTTIPNAFWAEFYGTRHLGAIKSMAAAVMVLGSAIGPGFCGLLIDRGYDFDAQTPMISAIFLFASAMIGLGAWLSRPSRPVAL
ncbi:MAG: MFS transporter [Pseudomonadota bacterium]